jgi:hypothetical protein
VTVGRLHLGGAVCSAMQTPCRDVALTMASRGRLSQGSERSRRWYRREVVRRGLGDERRRRAATAREGDGSGGERRVDARGGGEVEQGGSPMEEDAKRSLFPAPVERRFSLLLAQGGCACTAWPAWSGAGARGQREGLPKVDGRDSGTP